MNLKGLEALRAFMEGGSINAAADRLGRTQPQVSRLLGALEAEAGFPLFTREKRRLAPTLEGREFYAYVERALYSLDEVGYEARKIHQRQRRHVRILTAPHVTNVLLAEAIATLTEESPAFTATIDARSRLDIELWLGHEPFDLGITVLPLNSDVIEIAPMVTVSAVAVMHESHPLAARDVVTIDDLIGLPMVLNSPRTVLRQRVDATFRKVGAEPLLRLETPNGVVACELAARGLGLAVADGFVARSSFQPGMAIRRFEPSIDLEYVFIFPRWRRRNPIVDRFVTLIREAALRAVSRDHPPTTAPLLSKPSGSGAP
ncbi:LysR family transcriptional regulator [Pikeienuella sp. HZG-20]|uniref:LysR family transcriptional regulator n=1 Tax=Paludibacillus litoralis TaxID=3133267 RepID=UPI0030EDFE95